MKTMQLGKTIQMIVKSDSGIIKHMVKLRQSKDYREKTNRCVIHSDMRLLKELVYHSSFDNNNDINNELLEQSTQHTIPKKIAFYSNGDQDEIQNLVQELPLTHQFICFINESLLKKATGLQTVDPLNCFISEFAKPPERPILLQNEISDKIKEGKEKDGDDFRPNFRKDPPPSFVVINQIQDPGNVGNILRCCIGFGIRHVFFIKGSVDPFNEKLLRSSRGSLLLRDKYKKGLLSYECGSWDRIYDISKDYKLPIYVSDSQYYGKSDCIDNININESKNTKKIIVMNNEASGISDIDRDSLTQFGAKFIHIPMSMYCKSLNVASAASILLYTLRDHIISK